MQHDVLGPRSGASAARFLHVVAGAGNRVHGLFDAAVGALVPTEFVAVTLIVYAVLLAGSRW